MKAVVALGAFLRPWAPPKGQMADDGCAAGDAFALAVARRGELQVMAERADANQPVGGCSRWN